MSETKVRLTGAMFKSTIPLYCRSYGTTEAHWTEDGWVIDSETHEVFDPPLVILPKEESDGST